MFVKGKLVEFELGSINNFMECPTKVDDAVFDEGFEYSDEVLKKITSGRCSTWGAES